MGPLKKKRHQKAALSIIKHSDCTILRDQISKEVLLKLSQDFNEQLNPEKIFTSLDPAVQCLFEYQRLNSQNSIPEEKDYITVNLREFPAEYSRENKSIRINQLLFQIVNMLSDKFEDKKIRLIPMHYFHVGNDDRLFLNKIAIQLNKPNLDVQNINLTLEETMAVFEHAMLNIGMRFHSVVFQSILNGKNIILDYTEPQKGKIYGFLSDMHALKFYENRYINLQQVTNFSQDFFEKVQWEETFTYDLQQVKQKLKVYDQCLNALL